MLIWNTVTAFWTAGVACRDYTRLDKGLGSMANLHPFVTGVTDSRGQKELLIMQEEPKTEYRKLGPTMPRVRTLTQPPLDGEWPGPLYSPLFAESV